MSPGDLVGEYRIEGTLGRGGFGEVYSAVHPVIGKRVAIKILHAHAASSADAVARFTAEATAVNRISHPSIVDVFAFGQTTDGRHYYVMEILRGDSLDKRLAAGPLPPSEALPILRGIAEALDAAHDAGFVHRDLKPENVFLVAGGVKLIDFGLAKLVAAQPATGPTREGQIFGTPHYMAPEQCRGRSVTSATDIYALGVIAFRALTGTMPFDADDQLDILLQHVHDSPPRASSRVPLPAHIDDAIARMLAKSPEDRPRTAGDAVALLEQPERSRHLGSALRWVPPLAALGLLGGLAAWRMTRAEPRAPAPPPPAHEISAPGPPPAPATENIAASDARVPVHVRIETNITAELWRDGMRMGTTPYVLDLRHGEEIEIELRARGYTAERRRILAMRDRTESVELVRAARKRQPGPDDLEVRREP